MSEIPSFCGLWQLPQALLVVMEEDFLIFVLGQAWQRWRHTGQLVGGRRGGAAGTERRVGERKKEALLDVGSGEPGYS